SSLSAVSGPVGSADLRRWTPKGPAPFLLVAQQGAGFLCCGPSHFDLLGRVLVTHASGAPLLAALVPVAMLQHVGHHERQHAPQRLRQPLGVGFGLLALSLLDRASMRTTGPVCL